MTRVLAGHLHSFQSIPRDQALQGLADAGFAAVELAAFDAGPTSVDLTAPTAALTRALATHGLVAIGLNIRADLASADGVIAASTAVRWCADLGIAVLTTTVVGPDADCLEPSSALLSGLAEVARTADQVGVDVALETHGTLLATGERARALVDRLAHTRLRVAVDTGNCEYFGGVAAPASVEAVASRLANVHLKDKRGGRGEWDFPPLGDGHVDLRAVLAALDAAGYRGPLAVEIEFTDGVRPSLTDVVDAMRRSRMRLRTLGVT